MALRLAQLPRGAILGVGNRDAEFSKAVSDSVRHDLKGWIVLLAPCKEGIGSAAYEEAMHAAKDMMVRDALRFVIETYGSQETFKIGNQKPPDLFRILLDVAERNIKVVTELDPKELANI